MDDNTRMMLQLATLIAQQNSNNSSENSPANQVRNPLAELAKQLLISTTESVMPQITEPPLTLAMQQTTAPQPATAATPLNQNQPADHVQDNNSSAEQYQVAPPPSCFSKVEVKGQTAKQGKLKDCTPLRPKACAKTKPLRGQRKRGPKEREYFRTSFFCLPSISMRLPRFTSCDPREQELVRDYQNQGYGFPTKDYMDGKQQKTYLCLNHTAEKFQQFLSELYPSLQGKCFEFYRIDRQRNLVRMEVKTPRAIKGSKYQGTIIILPYPEKSSPPKEIVQIPRMDFSSLSEAEPDHDPMQQSLKIATLDDSYQNSSVSSLQDIKPFHGFDTGQSELFQRISLIKQTLAVTRNLTLRKATIVDDLLDLYRGESSICNYHLSISFSEDIGDSFVDTPFQTCYVFCIFWMKILQQHFCGINEVYPVIGPQVEEEIFEVLGRILAHGLLLCNYWPIQLSRASATFMMCYECSDELLVKSFKKSLSEFEQQAIDSALEESQLNLPAFSMTVEQKLSAVLCIYGCRTPKPQHLEDVLKHIAKSVLVCQPYWALSKMKEGMDLCCDQIFLACSEGDVESLYTSLVPNPAAIARFMQYDFSQENGYRTMECNAKSNFEKILWRMNAGQLAKLLLMWTGADCLCQNPLVVKFTSDTQQFIFENFKCLLWIPRIFLTFDEMMNSLNTALNGN